MALSNKQIAEQLSEVADLLESQEANPFRVRAYRSAAETVLRQERPVAETALEEGTAGLEKLPAIGQSLARALQGLVRTGRLQLLERLRGEAGGEKLLATVPGIGPELAHRVHERLEIETLEELEVAAHDGRLAGVPGFGRRRIQAVRQSLGGRLRPHPERRPSGPSEAPPVGELLQIDQEYRRKANADQLPRIAPRRFNPEAARWLPILHTERGPRHYTALFSNTARAHELGKTREWVVIYRDDDDAHGQWTVVTASSGKLRGRRIVRGREPECQIHYEQHED